VDHESCDPTLSKVNNVNDKSSRSNSTSATRVLDHGASDAATQPSCDSINSNDNTCRDVVSVIGVKKNPADIRNINKNIDNSVNHSNDNNASVVVADSGFVPSSGVGNIIYSTEVVAGNIGPDVNDSHVASNEVVVAGDSPSALPPRSSSEVEMVDALAVRK